MSPLHEDLERITKRPRRGCRDLVEPEDGTGRSRALLFISQLANNLRMAHLHRSATAVITVSPAGLCAGVDAQKALPFDSGLYARHLGSELNQGRAGQWAVSAPVRQYEHMPHLSALRQANSVREQASVQCTGRHHAQSALLPAICVASSR